MTSRQCGYYARVIKERGAGYCVEFPDLPGCLTEGDTLPEAFENARAALAGWLFVALRSGDEVPTAKQYRGRQYHLIVPDLDVAVPLTILSARKRHGLTQTEVAEELGMSQQAYRKLEVPGKSNPTLRTLERLSKVLDLALEVRAA